MAPTINITERLKIVEMWQNGGRASDIAKEMGLTRRTVYWWIKRHAVEGIEGLRDRPRGSRGRATTVEQDKALLEAHNNKSLRSTRDFAIKYNVSMETIRRRLREFNNGRPLTNRKKKSKKNPNLNNDSLTSDMHNIFNVVMHKDNVTNDGMRTYATLTPQRSIQEPIQQQYIPPRESIKCMFCNKDLSGARYKCMQCVDASLCLTCEANGAHPEHCVMRLTNEMAFAKVMPWLKPLRMALSDKRKIRPMNDRRKAPRPIKERKRKAVKPMAEKRRGNKRKIRSLKRDLKEEPEMNCLCHNLDTIPPLNIPNIQSIPSIPPIPQIEPITQPEPTEIHHQNHTIQNQSKPQHSHSHTQSLSQPQPHPQSQPHVQNQPHVQTQSHVQSQPHTQPQPHAQSQPHNQSLTQTHDIFQLNPNSLMQSSMHSNLLQHHQPQLQLQSLQQPLSHQQPIHHQPKTMFSHFRLPYQPQKSDKDLFSYANPLNYVKKTNET